MLPHGSKSGCSLALTRDPRAEGAADGSGHPRTANAFAPHIGTQGLHRVFGFRRQRMNPVTEDLHSNNQTKRLGTPALVELPPINMECAYLVKDLYGNLSNINASLLLFGTH